MLFEQNISNESLEGIDMPNWSILDSMNTSPPFVVSVDQAAPSLVLAVSGSRENKPCVIVLPNGFMF